MRCAVVLCAALATAAWAQPPEGWFEFTIGVPGEGSAVDVSQMNAAPAGEAGFITIRDGHFVDGSGERIRFLGTNLTFGDALPEKDVAPEIARRMARLGMNIVRFHHLDMHHAPSGIWDPDYEDRLHMDPEMLDRLDWIIYQLKQNGIYANINLHVSRKFSAAEGFENADQLPSYDKGVDNFEPRMIELQKQYARDLLTHENPYTGTAYVDEPCVAMVEITNEDSALRFALGNTLHTLPEPYATTLREMWMQWLREKYETTEALREAWDEGSEPLGEELLRNRDFADGTEGWTLEAPEPAQGSMEIVEDPERGRVLHAELTALGEQPWHFQIHQTGHTLEDGRIYTVSFAAKAEPPRTVHVNIRYDVPDWRMVGLNQPVELTEQWQQFSFAFRAREPLPAHTRLSFNNQNELGEVWYADVSLRPGGVRGLDEEQSLEAGNVELPTSASTDRARADWLAFVMELERRYTLGIYEFLKDDLGLHAQVIDTQATYGGAGGILRESRLDYADVHAYWEHPRFPGRPWDAGNWYIPNTPMTAALGGDTLTRLSQFRLAARPYTVSEYNHPAPNDYRAECMPMLAAWGALQDWDGLFQFCYGQHPEEWATDEIDGYFRMSGDPAKLAMFPVAANLFRRGDVQAAERMLTLVMAAERVAEIVRDHGNSMSSVWAEQGVGVEMALSNRLGVEVTGQGEIALRGEPAAAQAHAQVRWSEAEEDGGVFIVDTPGTKVALGPIAGRNVELSGVRLEVAETSNGYAAVALTSMDGRPLTEATRILLVAMNRVENQEMGWDEQRRTVGREWGHGPVICEGVPLTLTLYNATIEGTI
ncbi:MAG: carbohydrate binding domain-containing protein, partial [Armatimonadota bacterium]